MIVHLGHSIRFSTCRSAEETRRQLRAALPEEGLEVVDEFEPFWEINNSLGLSQGQYTILSVWNSIAAYQALLAIPEAGVFIPIHIVVTIHEGQTLVSVMDPEWLTEAVDRLGFHVLAKDLAARLRRVLATLN